MRRPSWAKFALLLLGLAVLGLLAAVASTRPDGLERVMETLGLASAANPIPAPLPDYSWPGHLPPALQGLLTVLLGGGVIWLLLWLLTRRGKGGGAP
jgi:hypothetical protein